VWRLVNEFNAKDGIMRLRLAAVFHCGTLTLLGVTPGMAAEVTADLHIDRVTVYRQGAVVTRAGEVSIPAGSNRLIVRGLPASIDSKTLRVTVEGQAVQLGGVELAKINEGKFVSEAERELRRRIEETGDQRVVIQDDVNTAETQLKLLDSLAANPVGSATRASVDGANLATVLTTMATSATAARKRMRDAHLKLRGLDRDLEKMKADLAKVATQSKQSTEVRASVEAAGPVTANVAVSYTIESAGWDWIYQARLDSAKRRIALDRQGSVHQGSGEDWKNVVLTLTTALPADDVATPRINSLFLDLQMPPPPRLESFDKAKRSVIGQVASPAVAPADLQEVIVTGGRRHATASSTDYIAEYKIPSRVSLSADREPRLYPIAEDEFDVDLVDRIVPSASHVAHLESVFKYQSQLPIEAGQLELYRDGAYVGAAETQAFLPGAEVRMPFGADERIRVAVRQEPAQSGQRGVIAKQTVKETRQRFEVTSYHPGPIPVEIIDRLPVSKNADIHVEILKGATEATVKDFEGKPGVLLWKLDAPPQKAVSIRHYYSVQYPSGRELEQAEADTADDTGE
jgi:uncharacterized protein (TIGR02231 family)